MRIIESRGPTKLIRSDVQSSGTVAKFTLCLQHCGEVVSFVLAILIVFLKTNCARSSLVLLSGFGAVNVALDNENKKQKHIYL